MVQAYLTIKHGHDTLGTLRLELYHDVVPKTVKNFMALLEGQGRLTYKNSISHRLIPGFMAQFGDITKGDGTGGESIYGPNFDDENFTMKHDRKGMLSMANSGPNTNGSQFFVTFRKTPHLDNKHVVFGHVDLDESGAVLSKLERIKTDSNDKPLKPVLIVDCGVLIDDDEEDDKEAGDNQAEESNKRQDDTALEDEEIPIDDVEEEEEEDETNLSKSQAIKNRLKKLKMKMNQARQLNRVALRQEGEAMGSAEGQAKARHRQKRAERKAQDEQWKAKNAHAIKLGEAAGVNAKYLVEPAEASIKNATRKAERAEANRFGINDTHNPEGQHRNYERNLKSIPRHMRDRATHSTAGVYNPMDDSTVDATTEREGARRMANELYRRIEKANKKRQRLEFDETDVGYINQRNKRFNQKISRNYDRATAEIKQNLERGTAL